MGKVQEDLRKSVGRKWIRKGNITSERMLSVEMMPPAGTEAWRIKKSGPSGILKARIPSVLTGPVHPFGRLAAINRPPLRTVQAQQEAIQRE
jgi:hypothetical protein